LFFAGQYHHLKPEKSSHSTHSEEDVSLFLIGNAK
jgi:hypothetical protein